MPSRQQHEDRAPAELPAGMAVVHDPAVEQRADNAADVEAGGDDAEGRARVAEAAGFECGILSGSRGIQERYGRR